MRRIAGVLLAVACLSGAPHPAAAQGRAGFGGVTYPRLIPSTAIQPRFPEAARNQGVEGKVILEALIDDSGSVVALQVLRCVPPGVGFEEAAIEAVSQWRYEPALQDGEPVDVYFPIVVVFQKHGASEPAGPESHEWNALMDEAMTLIAEQQGEEAEEKLRLAVEASAEFRDVRRLRTLESLADLLLDREKPVAALEVLEDLVVAQRRIHGKRHPEPASTLDRMARIQLDLGRIEEGRATLARAEGVLAKARPRDHPDLPALLENHAALLDRVGETAAAAAARERAASLRAARSGAGPTR